MSSQPSWGMFASLGREPGEFIGDTTVTVRRLDTAILEYNLAPPQVLKIDVEGAEIDVLRGAAGTVASYRPLMFIELHDTNYAIAEILNLYDYKTCSPGSSLPIVDVPGNVHALAIPKEQRNCDELIQTFQNSTFPQCARCHEIGRSAAK